MALRNLTKNHIVAIIALVLLAWYCYSLLYWRDIEVPCSHGLLATNPNRQWNNMLLFGAEFCFLEILIELRIYKNAMIVAQSIIAALIFNEYSEFREDWGIMQLINFYGSIAVSLLTIKYMEPVMIFFTNFIKNKEEC